MSDSIRSQVEAYRRRAEELRAAAEGTAHSESREAMVRLATGYDRLADNLERVADRSPELPEDCGAYSFTGKPRLVASTAQ